MDVTRRLIFRFWENRRTRNWGLTLAFTLIVLVGGRFAWFNWNYAGDVDRVLVVVGGIVVGAVSIVVVYRIWQVPPVKTLSTEVRRSVLLPARSPAGSEFKDAARHARGVGAFNKSLADDAAALGPPSRARF